MHKSSNLWYKFTIMSLVNNHRQNEDHVYAELLNRIRVRRDDTDIPRDALRVMMRNADVNAFNAMCLAEVSENDATAYRKIQNKWCVRRRNWIKATELLLYKELLKKFYRQ